MDFVTATISDRVARDHVLRNVEALIDWERVGAVANPVRSRLGRTGHDVALMVRGLPLAQRHSLSDREMEHALRVRLDFMQFCGASVFKNSPDHTTVCRLRLWMRRWRRAR